MKIRDRLFICSLTFLGLLAGCAPSKVEPSNLNLNQGDELVKVFEIQDTGQDYRLMIQFDRLPKRENIKLNVNGKTLEGSFALDTTDSDNKWYSCSIARSHLKKINGVIVKNLDSKPLSINCDALKDKNSTSGVKRLKSKSKLTKLTVSPRIKLIPLEHSNAPTKGN